MNRGIHMSRVSKCKYGLGAALVTTVMIGTASNAYANQVDGGGFLECRDNDFGDGGEVLIRVHAQYETEVSWNGVLRDSYFGSEYNLSAGRVFNTGLSSIDNWRVVSFGLDKVRTDAYCGYR